MQAKGLMSAPLSSRAKAAGQSEQARIREVQHTGPALEGLSRMSSPSEAGRGNLAKDPHRALNAIN